MDELTEDEMMKRDDEAKVVSPAKLPTSWKTNSEIHELPVSQCVSATTFYDCIEFAEMSRICLHFRCFCI